MKEINSNWSFVILRKLQLIWNCQCTVTRKNWKFTKRSRPCPVHLFLPSIISRNCQCPLRHQACRWVREIIWSNRCRRSLHAAKWILKLQKFRPIPKQVRNKCHRRSKKLNHSHTFKWKVINRRRTSPSNMREKSWKNPDLSTKITV